MKAPPGYRGADDGQEPVWKLKKAVYGLKQASACFWTAVHQHLIKLGFHSLTGDPCLFQKNLGGGRKMLVCCYVDDITYAVESNEIGDAFLDDMRKGSLLVKMKVNQLSGCWVWLLNRIL
jgi:hypothetical protein